VRVADRGAVAEQRGDLVEPEHVRELGASDTRSRFFSVSPTYLPTTRSRSLRTVRAHLDHIYEKLGVHTRTAGVAATLSVM